MASETVERIQTGAPFDAMSVGLRYDDYVSALQIHRDAFASEYEAVLFTKSEEDALHAISRSLNILAIVEEKCPDVIANLPIVRRIAQIVPNARLRILHRPDHRAVADAYPAADGRSHIPTYIVFDGSGRQLGVFIERPEEIQADYAESRRINHAKIDAQYPNTAIDDLPKEFTAQLARDALSRRRGLRGTEREALVRWLIRVAKC